MHITTKGNEISLELDPEEALQLIARLAESVNLANRNGSCLFRQGMPLRNEDLQRDFPGVLGIYVTKEQVGR